VKLTTTIATGVLFAWMTASSVAASAPVDRPTPPPCCADGQCFANPVTYGVYPTRWRRWPLECVEEVPTGQPTALPAPLQKEVPPFEAPPPEQEDRRAPPPTAPVGEQAPAAAAPGMTPRAPSGTTPTGPPSAAPGTQPPTLPSYPPPGLPTPQTSPLAPPAAPGTQPGEGPLYKGISPESPLNRSGPTGDLDPPPSLPFGPQSVAPVAPVREASHPATIIIPGPSAKPVQIPSNDPPPVPPASLASWEN
jgi:hypothetical protein